MNEPRTITMSEILKCSTWSKKDNSPRGCSTVSCNDIKPGDKVVYDNYFTEVIADPSENTMEKSSDILNLINDNTTKSKEITNQINKLDEIIMNVLSGAKNRDDRKKLHEKTSEFEAEKFTLKNQRDTLTLEYKFLVSNYRAAVYAELMPEVIKVLNNYTGKKLGPKTREKINNDLSNLSDNRIYLVISEYGGNYISINLKGLNYPENNMDISFTFNQDLNKRNNFTDDNNIINHFENDMFFGPYANKYYDDISGAIEKFKMQAEKINKMTEELNALKSEYNSFIPGNIKNAEMSYFKITI